MPILRVRGEDGEFYPIPSTIGPPGETGPQGPKGDQGDKGDTGERGPQGYVFTPAVDGSGNLSWTNDGNLANPETVNIRGPKGDKGETGEQGEQGETGPQGPQGIAGEDGGYYTPAVDTSGNLTWTASKTGMPGVSGANIKGPKGETGDTGPQGVQGVPGPQGPSGNTGPQGEPGTPGAQGPTGAAAGFGTPTATVDNTSGTPGVTVSTSGPDTAKVFAFSFTGLKGADGANGQDGATGEQGPAGTPGENGGYYTPAVDADGNLTWTGSKSDMPAPAGANIRGPQGPQGEPGAEGAQGPAGADGAPGAQGPQGEAGAPATINGVNALTLEATGGLTGQQSGTTYTIGLPSGGTDGQVLTKTESGSEWSDAPSGLPDGGTTGQVLTKGESGPEWADNPGMTQTAADARYLQLSGGTMTGALTLNGNPSADSQAANKAYVDSKAPKYVSVTLSASGWASNTQTVTVSGVSADETAQLIMPVPALASQTAYYEAGILVTGQAANSLTFTCQTVPTADLTVYIVMQEVGV